ncbi:13236_t:CDS:1 [Cetraspora pellucida]|uniref:13236_t:CDS:1 n=1 Tax=Cetraspora pellucida TaxID=1433469 RepID=A0A9N9ICE5_9GLOM|nr:13236_t:CDS:1 [Cetraspora pellucida]
MNYGKIHLSSACVIASCNDHTKTNSCIGKRDPEAIVDVFEVPAVDDKELIFQLFNERFQYLRLYQDSKFDHTNLELHDVVLKFEVTSFYRLDINETFQIPQPLEETKLITPVLSNSLKLTFYIVEICDKSTAEQQNPGMGDILLERDVHDVEFREYINPILKYKKEITYRGCMFQSHVFEFCLNFNKIKVCVLPDQTIAKTFNQGNYALVILIDYFDHFYKFKMKRGDANAILLGDTFDSTIGNCGVSLFLTYIRIESTWKPDFDSCNPMGNIFDLIKKCCKKKPDPTDQDNDEVLDNA